MSERENEMRPSSRLLFITLIFITSALFVSGCKDNITSPAETLTVLDDAAESVASAVGEENGGTSDQIADIVDLASGFGIRTGFLGVPIVGVRADTGIYDPLTGWWTVTINRSRSSDDGRFSASFTRIYKYQFLNASGISQRWYITNGDTARTVKMQTLEGSGSHRTPRLSHTLVSVTSDMTLTNAHRDTITINGTTSRQAVDTLSSLNATRIAETVISIQLTDVRSIKARPLQRVRMGEGISGTISGRFQGEFTFIRGDLYNERSVDRTFTITLGGDDPSINMGSRRFGFIPGWGQIRP